MVNGILWVLRTGAPWRDMPERYGNWNSVFVRFTRWSKIGVWDAAFGNPGESWAARGTKAHAIDSTIVRAHQHAAGVKRGDQIGKRSVARAADSRRKSTSARTPKATRSTFDVTGGEAHEVKGYDALMELHDINPDRLLGDKGY